LIYPNQKTIFLESTTTSTVMKNLTDDKFLDLKQLVQYSTFSDSTLRNYLSDPDNPIPYFRVKRKIIIKKSEFDRWMEHFRHDE